LKAHATAALLIAAFAGTTCPRARETEPFHVEDPSRWGKPTRVVLPEYPKEALAKRLTGYVDFEGVVSPLRDIEGVEFVADSPASEPFVAALKEVLPHWGFYPSLGKDCMPDPVRVKTRVWFELDGDKPRISVTRRRIHEEERVAKVAVPTRRREPEYPVQAQRDGLMAYVYSRLDVGEDGRVLAVASEAYPRGPDSREAFVRSNERAFLRWEFPPGPKRTVCMEVFYRLRN
jgi:hypothetical protein